MKLQFFHVDDLCKVIEKILEIHPKEHIFNVGNEKLVDINTFVDKYYEEHKDERKEYYKKHYEENKEARQQYYKEYYIKKKIERTEKQQRNVDRKMQN